MQKNLPFASSLTLILFLSACGSDTNTIDSTPPITETSNEVDSAEYTVNMLHADADSVHDEFTLGTKKCFVTAISQPKMFNGNTTWHNREEKTEIAKDKKVSRDGSKLVLTLENGSELILEDVPYNDTLDPMSSAYYEFQGSVGNLNYWQIYATGYEYHWTILINKKDGTKTSMIGAAIPSPSGKYILSGNTDLVAGYTSTGFELYEFSGDQLKEIGSVEIEAWGPEEVQWKTDSTLIIKQEKYNDKFNPYFTWAEMVIR